MANHNIQQLFSIIRPEQVEQYMTSRGWRCQRIDNRLCFESPTNGSSETRQLFFPADPSHPRFRSWLPNLVFSLSITEGREAIDVANDMADQPVAAALPMDTSKVASMVTAIAPTDVTTQQAGTQQIGKIESHARWVAQLININPGHSLTVHSRFNQSAVEVPVGQTLHVHCKPGTTFQLRLTSDCELDFRGATPPQLTLGLPEVLDKWRQQGWDIQTGLTDYLQAALAARSSADSTAVDQDAAESLEIARLVAEFTFLVGTEAASIELATLKKASARLLMAVLLPINSWPQPQASGTVLQLAKVLMAIGQQVLVADNSSAESLSRIMELDNPNSPHKTLEWLSLHSRGL